jgi:hypothetical protein
MIVCVGQGAWEEEAVEDTRALESICRARNRYRPGSTIGGMMSITTGPGGIAR